MKCKIKVLIVCHDAGGAEIVSAYVKKNLAKYSFICLAIGPAKKIFKRKRLNKFFISKKIAKEMIAKREIDLVLAGASWASSLELDFIKIAKQKNIKTIVYLEHWINHRERFGYPRKNWQKNLPDEIWLGDKYAFASAKNFFKNLPLKLVPNLYFKEIKDNYKKINKRKKEGKEILFLSEPISGNINFFGDRKKINFNEFEILKEVLDLFNNKKIKRKIIVRLHPSEKKNKYDDILKKYTGKLKIVKSDNKEILKDLIQSKIVIGMQSMALVVALLCNKKTISFLPVAGSKCVLPFKQIKRVKSIKNLKKEINNFIN